MGGHVLVHSWHTILHTSLCGLLPEIRVQAIMDTTPGWLIGEVQGVSTTLNASLCFIVAVVAVSAVDDAYLVGYVGVECWVGGALSYAPPSTIVGV